MFPTDYAQIQERIRHINPIKYSQGRNNLNGSTFISPYLTHGVISTKDVAQLVIEKYGKKDSYEFIFELAWREYCYKVWSNLGNSIEEDIDRPQNNILHKKLVKNIYEANTGINFIDESINSLYTDGFIHQQQRIFIAALTCNTAKAYWKNPSNWMYYHLLDGDIICNTLAWQMVAGTFDHDKIFINQKMINKFSQIEQVNSYIDKPIAEIKLMSVPVKLKECIKTMSLESTLPVSEISEIEYDKPVLLYSFWTLDPRWRNDLDAYRVLILEPSHFEKYPVSEKRMAFMLSLAKNIPDIKIYVGDINKLKGLSRNKKIYHKDNPFTAHWPGIKDERDYFFKNSFYSYNSYESFWENAENEYGLTA